MDLDSDELEARIKQQVEEWSSNSNECFTIDLIRGDGSQAATFQPAFTYPIFGEEEAIFGYQNLSINLSFAAHNLNPHLGISYSNKFKAKGEVRPTDIHEALRDFLPEAAFSNGSVYDSLRDDQAATFAPPGEKVHEYSREGHKYEIWCANLSDARARQLLDNMQVLIPMFIEGGTMLQLEQDWTTQRWKLFLLYQVRPHFDALPPHSKYSLLGYGTSYRVFTFPDRHNPLQADDQLFTPSNQSLDDFLPPPETTAVSNELAPTAMPNNMATPLDLPSRERLSQFLILPPFQSAGHGQQLYNTMYTQLTKPHNVQELTVEDPNEAFDDLRDLSDLLYLRAHVPEFAALRINAAIPQDQLAASTDIPVHLIVPLETRERIRAQTKIMQRQFDRLVEMHTLSFIPPLNRSRSRITRKTKASNENDKAYYFWRLYVKQRLYIFNRDQLAQLERDERVEKLESALDSVLEAYGKMIERVEKREKSLNASDANGDESPMAVEGASLATGSGTPAKVRPSKRKIIEEAEEDDDEGEDENAEGEGEDTRERGLAVNGHKKARME